MSCSEWALHPSGSVKKMHRCVLEVFGFFVSSSTTIPPKLFPFVVFIKYNWTLNVPAFKIGQPPLKHLTI